MKTGSIPVLLARGTSLAQAWENALVLLYNEGIDMPTEYDDPGGKGEGAEGEGGWPWVF